MNPDTIFIAGANQGVGFELISYILSQPKQPKFLFAGCKDPTATDTKFLKATAEKYNCVKIIPFDATIDGDIDSAVATTEMTMGADEGLNLLINNAGMVDSTGSDLASQTRQTMCSHFETNAVGNNNTNKLKHDTQSAITLKGWGSNILFSNNWQKFRKHLFQTQ